MAEEANAIKGGWQEFRRYVAEVRTEMKRVTWPNRQEVYSTTVMVILTTFLFGAFFFVCDWVFQRLVAKILTWGSSL